jgi:hypothetical protein
MTNAYRKIAEKMHRLREMPLKEILSRISRETRIAREQLQLILGSERQEDSSWWQNLDCREISGHGFEEISNADEHIRATSLLPSHFAGRKQPTFYWSLSEKSQIVNSYKTEFPNAVRKTLCDAEAICEHRFRIFAYPEVSCGAHIPWRKDLIHQTESGLEHFARYPILDVNRVGDTKVVWEINRHQHFITLCLAYLFSGEERFAEECLSEWEDWLETNPYLRGINWASSLEVAFRCWSWTWMFYLLLGSPSLTGARIGRLTRELSRSARFIANNLSVYFAPNTHLLGEGFSLFTVGLLFPELKGAKAWQELGKQILVEQIMKQVREDGSHFEQSLFYHRYAVEFFLCAGILARRNQIPFPPVYDARLETMLEFLTHTAWPTGRHPSIGDSDGGRLIPFGSFESEDHRSVLSTAALYFSRGDFKKAAGGLNEQTLWLLGSEAVSEARKLSESSPKDASRTFHDAGVVSMRSDWSTDAKFMLFDAGPQGMGASAHGHGDSLSVVCAANGVEWLIDPGTYVYSSSREWRDFFRSTPAHNTVVIDGMDQGEQIDWFKWRKLPAVRLEREFTHPVVDFAVGTHKGYARLPQPVNHRRKVVFVKPDYWLISDELMGDGKHFIAVFFHFAPDVSIQPYGQGWLATSGRERFLLLPFESALKFRTIRGELSPIQGWSSSDYGHQEPTSVLIGEVEAQLPQRFHWLLFPVSSMTELPEVVELSDKTFCFSLATSQWTDSLVLNTKNQRAPGTGSPVDAELRVERKDRLGKLKRLVLLGGSSFSGCEIKVFPTGEGFEHFIADWSENGLSIDANPLPRFQVRADFLSGLVINGEPQEACADMAPLIFGGEN